ncbi:hypothetical protein LAU42_07145 [Macrococcus armenti]|uniref:hypothetical protein n=1 Tax=Macrococcus armenti TaxID=2875764 RepID=UPI001CD00EC0|nr:hypothetical protein [Macrococcus armenti]UBH21571.1 hypothetical protein LAU42_07145 [Macrococcus armenti]
MVKFKVGFDFKDLEENKVLKKGEEVDRTVKRADEINEKLKGHGTALVRVDDKK